jgi:hypothetical protein
VNIKIDRLTSSVKWKEPQHSNYNLNKTEDLIRKPTPKEKMNNSCSV